MSTIKHSQISALLVDDDAKLCGLLAWSKFFSTSQATF